MEQKIWVPYIMKWLQAHGTPVSFIEMEAWSKWQTQQNVLRKKKVAIVLNKLSLTNFEMDNLFHLYNEM